MTKQAAFFDIDGTILREGMISEMFRKMIKFELIDDDKWYSEVKPAYTSWERREGEYDDYLKKMVDIYAETIPYTDPFHIAYIARKVIEQKGARVYTYSRERIQWHKEQGHLVIAISGSPMELVREMAMKYEMDDYRGTIYQVGEDGCYTGDVIPMWDSRSKKAAMFQLAQQYDIDLAESFAYGDTTGDYSMMELVGHPFAVNPTRELLGRILENAAMKEKISVVVERKDVAYLLNPDQIELLW